jgi:hypothetical protein
MGGGSKDFYHRLSDGDISFTRKTLFRQSGLLRDPLVRGGSKDFITVFQTVIFHLVGGSFQASGITA